MSKASRLTIAEIVGSKSLKPRGSKRLARETAAYFLANGRTNELDSLLRDVWAYQAEHGQVEVMATSAHPLNSKIEADVRREVRKLYPKAKQIIITERHDPEVVGGVRLELPNQQLDLSVRAKLNKFRQLTSGDRA